MNTYLVVGLILNMQISTLLFVAFLWLEPKFPYHRTLLLNSCISVLICLNSLLVWKYLSTYAGKIA